MLRLQKAVRRTLPGSNHRHSGAVEIRQGSAVVQNYRRIINIFQANRIRRILYGQKRYPFFIAAAQDSFSFRQIFIQQRRNVFQPRNLRILRFIGIIGQFRRGKVTGHQKGTAMAQSRTGCQPEPISQHCFRLLSFHLPHHDGSRHSSIERFTFGIHGNNHFLLGLFQKVRANPLSLAADDNHTV